MPKTKRNKRIIYVVRYFANPDWNKLSWRKNSELADSWTGKKIYPRLEQFRCLAPFIHRYAERIGADVKVIEPKLKQDFFWEWEGNDLHHFFSKLECFIHFKDSDYDKMLYIDGDVLINNSALDIFNEVEDGFAYAPAMFPRKARMYVRWHQMCFGARPLKPMMNGGRYSVCRER